MWSRIKKKQITAANPVHFVILKNKIRKTEKQADGKLSVFNIFLETATKFLTLSGIVGMILGCVMAFVYLKNIGYLSIFPNVMSEPSTLVAVILVIGLLFLLFSIIFFAPYVFLLWSKSEKNPEIINFFHKRSSCCGQTVFFWMLTWIAVPYFFILLFSIIIDNQKIINLFTIYAIFLCPLVVIVYWLISISFLKQNKIIKNKEKELNGDGNKQWLSFILFLCFIIPMCILISLLMLQVIIMIIMITDELNNGIKYLLLFGYEVLFIFNNYFVVNYSSLHNKNKDNGAWIGSLMLAISLFLGIIFLTKNYPYHIFTPIGFVEKTSNASWYLLHNNFQKNNGEQEVNGIEKADLSRLKEKFKMPLPLSCHIADSRNNALYGYMAWNLGDTKVFCPASVSNYQNVECKGENGKECNQDEQEKANKEALKQCLVIDGKFLQIMDEQYIAGIGEKFP